MTRDDHLALLAPGLESRRGRGGTWADLGAGSGSFTRALAEILGPSSVIHAVDRDAQALRSLSAWVRSVPSRITTLHGDFSGDLALPPLDGILMANSLHFHGDACRLLRHAARWLKPGGLLMVVEYDIAAPSIWVPHPLPWERFPAAAECAGFTRVRRLQLRPSAYNRTVYSAAAEAAVMNGGPASGANAS